MPEIDFERNAHPVYGQMQATALMLSYEVKTVLTGGLAIRTVSRDSIC